MKRGGTACSRVHVLAAGGLHTAAVLVGEQGSTALPFLLQGNDGWFPTPFTCSLPLINLAC